MTDFTDPPAPADAGIPPVAGDGWHRLPARGAMPAGVSAAFALSIPVALASGLLGRAAELGTPWVAGLAGAVIGAGLGAWLGVKSHRRTLWRLDEEGFALQRGRWWQSETRVPISRVQHLDLKRGPLARALKLATLVIHTAGTRMAAVSVSGLDSEDAERLRDRLARQLDHDDDAL